MDVSYGDDSLKELFANPEARTSFDKAIVRAYRKIVNFIYQVTDERAIYAWTSLRFERLKGSRSHQHSLRLNDQWRLIVEVRKGNPKNAIHVVGIEDYH